MGIFGMAKKGAAIDKKMAALGFKKLEDTDAVIVYSRKTEFIPHNHVIMISRRPCSAPLIRSEDRKVNVSGHNDSIAVDAYVMALVLKKIKTKRW